MPIHPPQENTLTCQFYYFAISFILTYSQNCLICQKHRCRPVHYVQRGQRMKFWRVPLDTAQIVVSKGVVYIIEDRCKGCGYCIEYCPRDVLEASERFNSKGYHPPAIKQPDLCVNCHYCEAICPDFAIYSLEVPAQRIPELSIQ